MLGGAHGVSTTWKLAPCPDASRPALPMEALTNRGTAATEHALKEHMPKHDNFSTQDLLKITERMQPDKPVGEQFLRTRRRNRKTHKGPEIAPSLWRVFDWEQLIRTMPSLASLEPRPLANQLVCVSHDLSPSNTVVIFVNPALFCETMKQLSNPGYIKLCGDGTFRLILGDWVLMNLRALTKHYAPVSGAHAFRPTFLHFCLVSQTKKAVLLTRLCSTVLRTAPMSASILICHRVCANIIAIGVRERTQPGGCATLPRSESLISLS